MNRLPTNAKVFLVCTTLALLIQFLARYVLFQADLLQSVSQRSQGPLIVVSLLVVSRAFLYFVAPGWLAYLGTSVWIERRQKNSRN